MDWESGTLAAVPGSPLSPLTNAPLVELVVVIITDQLYIASGNPRGSAGL